MNVNWRSIKASEINWHSLPGVTKTSASRVASFCEAPSSPRNDQFHPFHSLNLGQIAEMGERGWRGIPGLGNGSVMAIKLAIDFAAAGRPITEPRPSDAYVPQTIPGADRGA